MVNYYKATEKFLYNYNSLKASTENMKQEIEELDYREISAVDYEKEPSGKTYAFHSKTEESAIYAAEKKKLLEQRIKTTERKLDRIDRAVEALNEIEQKIIKLRYYEGRQWWQIAYEMRYSEKWCKELRRRAVHKVAIGLFGEDALIKDFPFTSLQNG
jgi:DNA-directed RNA polymerase specialized sigma subunit